MSLEVYLTYHINCMFALILIMEMSYTTTKELIWWIALNEFNTRLVLLFQVVDRELTVENYTKNLGGNPCLIDDGSVVEIYFINSPMDYLHHIWLIIFPQRSVINISLRTRNQNIVCRTEIYENSFFPFCIKNWNSLDESIRSLPSISLFKTHLLKFVRPLGHSSFGIRDRIGSKRLSQTRVGFSDLIDQRFNHKFNCASPTCKCGIEDEIPVHYFLCCPRYNAIRLTFLSRISDIGTDVNVLPNGHLFKILVYCSNTFNDVRNKLIITETIQYVRKYRRFKILEAYS